jgi:hypothetical protein
VDCPFLYASLEDGVKSFMGTGPSATAMNNNSRQIVEDAIATALQPFRVVDDFYFQINRFLVFIAEK